MAKGKYEKWLEPDGLLLLAAWTRDGLTDEQIAEKCDISRSTLALWKNKFSDISDSLKRGKEPVDVEVENALLKKAMGFYVPIKKHIKLKKVLVKDGERREIEELVEIEEQLYIPPETVAQIFWLKNRKPEQWREKPVQPGQPDSDINENIMAIAELIRSPRPNRGLSSDE